MISDVYIYVHMDILVTREFFNVDFCCVAFVKGESVLTCNVMIIPDHMSYGDEA